MMQYNLLAKLTVCTLFVWCTSCEPEEGPNYLRPFIESVLQQDKQNYRLVKYEALGQEYINQFNCSSADLIIKNEEFYFHNYYGCSDSSFISGKLGVHNYNSGYPYSPSLTWVPGRVWQYHFEISDFDNIRDRFVLIHYYDGEKLVLSIENFDFDGDGHFIETVRFYYERI